MFKLSERSLENRKGIDSRLIEISDLAITITIVDFGHGPDSGLRSANRQHELFLTGKSKADGFKKIGKHQLGKALDFYAFVDGTATWDKYHLSMVAAAFLQAANILGYKIRWGGLWKNFKDYPHIELIGD